MTEKTVIVTGFGPFEGHSVNASWAAVQEFRKGQKLISDINLVTQEIPVEYEKVKTLVPILWKKHKPILVVHVGVSSMASELTLEQLAHNDGYDRPDVVGKCPDNECCIDGVPDSLKSEIDMSRVCDVVNRSDCLVQCVVSHDPGRFLCDFSYYTSLSQDASRSAFIHVPPLLNPYTAQELGHGLEVAIKSMLDQIS